VLWYSQYLRLCAGISSFSGQKGEGKMRFTIDWYATESRTHVSPQEAKELGRKFYDMHVRVVELLGKATVLWIEAIEVIFADCINTDPETHFVRFRVVFAKPATGKSAKGKPFEAYVAHCHVDTASVEELAEYVVWYARKAIEDRIAERSADAQELRALNIIAFPEKESPRIGFFF